MANEVNTLNIGGTSYPIYSEGIKVDSSVGEGASATSFLVAGGTGNRKISVSNAISGNDEEMTIYSNSIELGYSATNISIGDSATNVNLGKGKTTTTNGTTTKYTTTEIGENNLSLNVGETAGIIYFGRGASTIILGSNAGSIYIGDTAGTVDLGDSADIVNVGYSAANVNVGNDVYNVTLGAGKTTTDSNGTVTKHTTTKIGENNNSVYLGASASNVSLGAASASVTIGGGANYVWLGASAKNVYLGGGATSVTLGAGASQISIGPNVHQNINRNTILINDVGELYMTGTHTDISDADYESHISMEYDSGQGAMSLNLAAGASGVINIGAPAPNLSSMLNINSDHISLNGSATIDINGTNGIRMTGSDYNFIVQPNVSTINGFNIIHQKNSNIGIVCYTPSASAPVLFMTPRAAYSSSATVHLGTTTKRFGTLYVTSGKATSGFTTDSDERLKDFGDNIEVDLDALAALRKSYYRWNETSSFENEKERMLGMSAQEVQKLYPELVDADENGMLAMAYDRLSVVALAAIDKLHNENKELKSENTELKDRLTRLENLVNEKLSAL